jgi:methylthioribose-1-phosphate isomerase
MDDFGFSDNEVARLLTLSKVPKPIIFKKDMVLILDQRLLPHKIEYIEAKSWQVCRDGIKDMAIRGAPIIGVCGAYGVALAALYDSMNFNKACYELKNTRPTAVNLSWAVDKVCNESKCNHHLAFDIAQRIELDDHKRSFALARNGAKLINDNITVLTHCNTGSLAAGGFGTALGAIAWAHIIEDKKFEVINTETRPYLQGARLTSFELMHIGVNNFLIPDMAVAHYMGQGRIEMVIVGADRIVKNGDTANKIGTMTIAICAKESGIPFYVSAPKSTFDMSMERGSEIPIEERAEEEVAQIKGIRIAPEGVKILNPAFDVTPSKLVSGYVTENGVLKSADIAYLS